MRISSQTRYPTDRKRGIEKVGNVTVFKRTRVNDDIREYARKNGVFMWEIAEYLHISEVTLSRHFRHELPETEKEMVLQTIDRIRESHDGR